MSANQGQNALTTFLKKAVGNRCLIVLNTGTEFQGILCTIDGFFNLVLREAEEYVNSQKVSTYGSIFIRGNNVTHLTPISA